MKLVKVQSKDQSKDQFMDQICLKNNLYSKEVQTPQTLPIHLETTQKM